MADTYIGINGQARRIKKIYIGKDGKACQITKAYIGVGGVARQILKVEQTQTIMVLSLVMNSTGTASIAYRGSASYTNHCLLMAAYNNEGVLIQRLTITPDYSVDNGGVNTYTTTEALTNGVKYKAFLYESITTLKPVVEMAEWNR